MAYAAWFSASAKIKPFSHVHCVKVAFSSEHRVCCLLLALSSSHLTHTQSTPSSMWIHVRKNIVWNCSVCVWKWLLILFFYCSVVVSKWHKLDIKWLHCVSSLSSFLICRNRSERRPNVIVVTSVCRFSTHLSQSCRGQKEIDAHQL